MSESIPNPSFDDLFAISRSFPAHSRERDGYPLGFQKLTFGLMLLEDNLLNICLPYLESDDDKLLFDESLIREIKSLVTSLGLAIPEHAGNAEKEVWHHLQRRVADLKSSSKATNVLLTAIGVAALRRSMENLRGFAGAITISCSRAHASFHGKLLKLCNPLGDAPLKNAESSIDLRNVKAVLEAEV